MACRAATLEQENIKLRAELEQLKNETGHLRALMLHAPVKVIFKRRKKFGNIGTFTRQYVHVQGEKKSPFFLNFFFFL